MACSLVFALVSVFFQVSAPVSAIAPAQDVAPARSGGSSSEPASLPRYQFQVGQEAVYEHSWEFNHENGLHGQTGQWRLKVLAVDADGRATFRIERRVKPYQARGADRYEGAESLLFDRMAIAPDGAPTYQVKIGSDLNPFHLIPRLPRSKSELESGWFANYPDGNGTSHYTFEKTPTGWVIDDTEQTSFSKVYDIATRRRFVFEGGSPFPTSVELTSRQGYGLRGAGTGGLKLLEVKTSEVGTEEADLAAYLNALSGLNEQRRKASEAAPDKSDALVEAAAVALQAAAESSIQSAVLKQTLLDRAQRVRLEAPYVKQAAERRARMVGATPVPWSTTDLDGEPFSIADYHGQVVLLDFWYRGSGWCIRNMPTLNRIADRFKGEPFHVLGMNTDGNPDDAQFVVDAMKLRYPVLKGGPATVAYEVRVYPTILILDHLGVVRELHLGFVPNLEDELVEEITPLLEAAKKAKP